MAFKKHNILSFKTVEVGDIENEINNINPTKATTRNSIPPKTSRIIFKVSTSVLHKLFKDSMEKCEFPQNLKSPDITSVYKKNDPSDNKLSTCQHNTHGIKNFQKNNAKTN